MRQGPADALAAVFLENEQVGEFMGVDAWQLAAFDQQKTGDETVHQYQAGAPARVLPIALQVRLVDVVAAVGLDLFLFPVRRLIGVELIEIDDQRRLVGGGGDQLDMHGRLARATRGGAGAIIAVFQRAEISMAKAKRMYGCTECGATFPKWAGQCGECGAWNTLTETMIESGGAAAPSGRGGWAGQQAQIKTLAEVSIEEVPRFSTVSGELDRVLGGGLVDGSVVLIGGDPGIGKSTILLQTLCNIAQRLPALYVTGEESQQQVAMRARRLELPQDKLKVMTETCIESIIDVARREQPKVMVIDSIQTIFTEQLQSAPGGVAQVRESAALLVRFAKQSGTAIFLVGHVTKEGALAGPRVLEHMVDTVLYFEGESDGRLRLLRAVKNRFGAVNELGVFGMTDKGLKEVTNPSAIFLTRAQEAVPGSVVMATWEGTRPMLVEVQALVDTSHMANPKRVTLGLDQNRLAMLLAVLHRHGGIPTYDQDVFLNVVGGVKVLETASDLALMAAVISSLRNKPLPHDLLVFGEIGLSGEIRPVPSGQERLKEAAKHGFKRAIVPKGNAPKEAPAGLQIIAVPRLEQALDALFE